MQKHEKSHDQKPDKNIEKVSKSKFTFTCYVCHKYFKLKEEFENHIADHEQENKFDNDIAEDTIEQYEDEEYYHESADSNAEIDAKYIQDTEIVEIKLERVEDENNYDENEINEEAYSSNFMNVDEEEIEDQDLLVDNIGKIKSQVEKKSVSKTRKPEKKLERIICDICGQLFQTKSHLRRHNARKHRDKKDYKFECEICLKTFLLRYDLTRHMIKHDSTREIECSLCNKKFKTKDSLNNHIKLIHTQTRNEQDKQFSCNICMRSYFHKRHLDYHMR